MKRATHRRRLWVASVMLCCCTGGTCIVVAGEPPPEAVLEGTWDLVTEQDEGLTKTVLIFDSVGRVVEVVQEYWDPVLGNMTIRFENSHRSTNVDGMTVSIETKTNLVFVGTFDDDMFKSATGELSTKIAGLGITIEIKQGTATLTKRE